MSKTETENEKRWTLRTSSLDQIDPVGLGMGERKGFKWRTIGQK